MRKKMIISYIALLLFFSLFIVSFVLEAVYQMVEKNLIQTAESSVVRWGGEFDALLETAFNEALNFSIEDKVQEILIKNPETALLDDNDIVHLDDLAKQYLYYSNTFSNGHIRFSCEITKHLSDGTFQALETVQLKSFQQQPYSLQDPFIQKMEQAHGQYLWQGVSDANGQYLQFSKLIYNTADYSEIIGTITIRIHYEQIALSILNHLRNESDLFSAVYNGTTNEPIGYYTISIPDSFQLSELARGKGIETSKNEFLFVRRLSNTNFYLVCQKSLAQAQTEYLAACFKLLCAGAAALVLGIIMAFIITKRMMRPIVDLSQTMKNVQNGDLDIRAQTTQKEEIGQLYDSFNYMIQMINQLIEENYVTRLNQKQSELNALQSQINTHFLYNTLDSINWLAKDHHIDSISELVTSLSTLLRTSLNNGNPTLTVEDEVRHAQSYLKIQQIRFPDSFTAEINVAEECRSLTVIKMLLQPLIENALLHAFHQPERTLEDNYLEVKIFRHEKYLCFHITNTAFPDAFDSACEALNQPPNGLCKSYGIQSIKDRLMLSYNREALFYYTSETRGNRFYLTARIEIPIQYTQKPTILM